MPKKVTSWGIFFVTLICTACAGERNNREFKPVPAVSLVSEMTRVPASLPTQPPTLTPSVKGVFPTGWVSYTNANSITDLAFDQAGDLWAASEGGVTKWNLASGTYQRYTVSDGLPSNNVTAILSARDDRIWVGTQYG